MPSVGHPSPSEPSLSVPLLSAAAEDTIVPDPGTAVGDHLRGYPE
jgi:hypothetical protein